MVVIKSTIFQVICQRNFKNNKNLVINPEFLREKFADEDFINSEIIIFGGDSDNCSKLSHFYKNHTNVFVMITLLLMGYLLRLSNIQ